MTEDEIVVPMHAVNEVGVYLRGGEMGIVDCYRLVGPSAMLQILGDHPHDDFGIHPC